MTIIEKTGNIFHTTMPAIAHGVNVKGLMSAGIALKIALKFPRVVPPYTYACLNGRLKPGFAQPVLTKKDFYIINLATQKYPGSNAKLEWISSAVREALIWADKNNIPGFAMPRIGSGIGGLKWEDVESVIQKEVEAFPNICVEIWKYEK